MLSKLDAGNRFRVLELCALLLVAVVGMLGWLMWNYRQTVIWVEHTMAAKASISAVFDLVQFAESATRGFVITNDPVYLPNYQNAQLKYDPAIEDLRDFTRDNPVQQRNLEMLKSAMDARFARFKLVVDLRRKSTIEEALLSLWANDGPSGMRKVQDVIDAMQIEEDRLLLVRVADVRLATVAIDSVSLIAVILISASLLTWLALERRNTREIKSLSVERERNEGQIRQMHKIEAIGQLTGGLAHDLNNMLAVIVSGLNLAQKRLAKGDAKIERFLDAAMDGATRAATLTTRLMAFARQLPLSPQRIDANHLVAGMTDLVRRTLGETIVTETVLDAGLWSINADASQLENAVLNLAINARDAMPDGGHLTIETTNCNFNSDYARQNDISEGQYVQISVTDTGVGMTAETIAKAFDPFFTTKGVGKGTGLGLSQVWGFIKQSGGNIKIYSEAGHGTTIKMYLPRLYVVGPAQEAITVKAETWPNLHGDNSAQLILVVEDDPRVNEMTVSSLRELGYTVIHANGANRALEQLDTHPATAMLFTDIVMPDINGRQLAAEALRRFPKLKVLYTTGFTRNAIIHSGKLDAGLHFIAKPFTLVQVAAKINEVLAA